MSTYNKTILISPYGRHEEFVAGGTIKPGHLVEVYNASAVEKVRVHSDEDAPDAIERMFAEEDALQGESLDHTYSALDVVGVRLCMPGDVVYAWLKASENVVIGDKLVSAGDGTLKKAASADSTTEHSHVVAVCLLASNTGSAVRIPVRVL